MIGSDVGKNSTLLNGADIDFMVDVLVRADRGKNDTSRMEDVDEIKVINSMLYQKQAKDNLDWRLLTKAHADGKI